MLQMNSASAEIGSPTSGKRGVLIGSVAGVIALGCCVGPAVAALLGITTAAVAIDLATDLYGQWGWSFKLAGLVFAGTAVAITIKRSRSCSAEKPRLLRFLMIFAFTAVSTYGLLYVGTTWLGAQASPPVRPIVAEGDSIEERVTSVVDEARRRYPDSRIELEGLSPTGVQLRIGWERPDTDDPLSDAYTEEISRRVKDSREVTIVLLQAIARSVPGMTRLSAYEDRIFIPIWSRDQILAADASELREFDRFISFVSSAADRGGYSILNKGKG